MQGDSTKYWQWAKSHYAEGTLICSIFEQIQRMLKDHVSSIRSNPDFQDPEIFQVDYSLEEHSLRDMRLAAIVAETAGLGLDDRNKALLFFMGLTHDLGKLPFPHIYLKKAPLSPEDRKLLDSHAHLSRIFLDQNLIRFKDRESRMFLEDLGILVEYHHQPNQLISINARLAVVATAFRSVDLFVALTEKRWRDALKVHEAMPYVWGLCLECGPYPYFQEILHLTAQCLAEQHSFVQTEPKPAAEAVQLEATRLLALAAGV